MDANQFVLIIMIITISHEISYGSAQEDHINPPFTTNCTCSSSCGNIKNISFPFRLETDPPSCGISSPLVCAGFSENPLKLSCKNNLTTMNTGFGELYRVQAINYQNYTIRVVGNNLQKGNCSSFAGYQYDLLFPLETEIRYGRDGKFWSRPISETIAFLACEKPVFSPSYVDTTPCINISTWSESLKTRYSYAVYGSGFKYSDLAESCHIVRTALITSRKGSGQDKKKKKMMNTSYQDIHDQLAYGFELTWFRTYQKDVNEHLCYVDEKSNQVHCINDNTCEETRGARWCSKNFSTMHTFIYTIFREKYMIISVC